MKDVLKHILREIDGIKIVDLSGNLTSSTIDIIENEIKALSEKENLILNLVNVKLVTSTGLNFLVEVSYFAKEHGKRIIILWPSEDLIQMVDQLDMYEYLIFAESIEEGRTKIQHYT